MGLFKKIVRGGLIRSVVVRLRDLGSGQSGDWRRNLRNNAPRVLRSALGDIVFIILAIIMAVMFLIAGIYQFFFASPLSATIGGDMPSGVFSGVKSFLGALAGLLDELFGILLVVVAIVVRFSRRLLALLIGNRPADEKGALFSWIALAICFAYFIFAVFVW